LDILYRRFQKASRIINSGSCRCSWSQSTDTIGFSWSLYFVGLCVIFSLIPFPYFNQSTETALTAMQITIWSSCNGRTSKKRAIGLMYTIRARKVKLANWQSPSCCFYFSKRRKQNNKRNGLPMTESH
jgi:hypothetical protein